MALIYLKESEEIVERDDLKIDKDCSFQLKNLLIGASAAEPFKLGFENGITGCFE